MDNNNDMQTDVANDPVEKPDVPTTTDPTSPEPTQDPPDVPEPYPVTDPLPEREPIRDPEPFPTPPEPVPLFPPEVVF